MHRLPVLERTPLGPERDAEGIGLRVVEAARALFLDERVPDRRDAVVDREHADLVAVVRDPVAAPDLDELDRVGEPAEHPPERVVELAQARRPVDRERHVAHP